MFFITKKAPSSSHLLSQIKHKNTLILHNLGSNIVHDAELIKIANQAVFL